MLQQSTFTFLKNLKKNNSKEWFDANRKSYEAARADFINLIHEALQIHSKKDEDVASLNAKETVFRINRDIRFSKNKTPYKTHFAAGFGRGGKKSMYAGYYLHIEPGNNSIIGGGVWMPEADVVKKIRQEIDYSFDELSGIIHKKTFGKMYGDIYTNKEVKLIRPPKGYDDTNKAIEYLKLKSFIATKTLKDEELTHKNVVKTITESLEALQPLLRFLNKAIEG
ncbi:MAG: DUF2461 domain-containing protein [Bacteroidota bacterium]|nr:DUF2461 domain-containing protein [Bacteroidota bacterium]